jgi:hypothetical protein
MKIKCTQHGWFTQKPYSHYGGSGCIKCAFADNGEKKQIDFDEFVRIDMALSKSLLKQHINAALSYSPDSSSLKIIQL